ncbi:MAG: hypothetical protein GX455_01105 [Phycisphaerae bacterium]|nr:hypothetical protein [Phycisphaerae bacterium]
MAAGKSSESHAMLYTLITFVALFLIAAIAAGIYYAKAEEYRTNYDEQKKRLDEVAGREQGNLAKIVGKIADGKSALGMMELYLNQMIKAITGQESADLSAAAKVNEVAIQINKLLDELGDDQLTVAGQEGITLLGQIGFLKTRLDEERAQTQSLQAKIDELAKAMDQQQNNAQEHETNLIAEKDRYQQQANEIQKQYDELKALMEQSTEQQVQNVIATLDKTKKELADKNTAYDELAKKLQNQETALKTALAKLEAIKPRPDIEVAAFRSDAKIVRIDPQAKVVYLNVGSNDHVYRGLTFSVYDSSAPIPEDGKGKAEIEVFEVSPSVSAARILTSSLNNPIVSQDIVANLIWDSQSSNNFVVVGQFDLNNDGLADKDGNTKVRELIQRWGGKIQEVPTIETDFVILGIEPTVPIKPTAQQIESDPMAQQRYQAAEAEAKLYNQTVVQAKALSVPTFNQKRFLYLVGYDLLAAKSTPK